MASQNQQTKFWSYSQPVARLVGGALAAEVDIARPQLGLQRLSWQSQPLAVQLLGVRWETDGSSLVQGRDPHWPMRLAEAYVRANDLVATYLSEPAWPYRPQIYWCANVLDGIPQALASLSLVVSIQTDSLDTRPELHVVSHLSAEELVHVAVGDRDHSAQTLTGPRTHILESSAGTHCLVMRLPDGETSYVECVPASDFQEVWVSPANDETKVAKLEWVLFNESLEKGVIRRARVQSLFLPRENDVEVVAECCRALESRPLPLTT